MSEEIFTAAELAEVKAYSRPAYVWAGIGVPLNLVLLLVLLRLAVRPLYALAERTARAAGRLGAGHLPVLRAFPAAMDRMWGGAGWGAAMLFAVYWDLLSTLIYLPLNVYFGWVLEHRHGLSRYTPAGYALDSAKEVVASLVPQALLALGLFGLARRLRAWWWVLGLVGAAALLLSAAVDPYRARLYFDQAPLEAGPLRTAITGLMGRADIEVSDVLVERTSRASAKVQAYFAGAGPTRTIVLNDELLRHMDADEVLAAVAHEAGHVREPRWPGYLGSALALLAFLFAVHRLLARGGERGWFGATGYGDIRVLPVVWLVFFLAAAAVRPASAAFSRARERAADDYALRLTGQPDAFRRMLVKAARVNKLDPSPPRWVVLRGLSHPPVAERLKRAAAYEARQAEAK